MGQRIRVVHVINSFEFGGAEAMLCNLLVRMNRARFEPSVVSLINQLTVAGPIREAGIELTTLGMEAGVPDPRGLARLVMHLRRVRPDVVQTWMDHSNLIGGIAARLAGIPHVVWGIHHSDHIASLTKRLTHMTLAACTLVSRRMPSCIVCCSEHSRILYARRGFSPQKMMVIPNGFDTSRFRPDPLARRALRRELGFEPNAPLVGLIGRYHVLKDHPTFLRSAALLARQRPDVRFVLCGTHVDDANVELTQQIRELGLSERCRLLGIRRDMPRICAALDALASSSISEAFPLVIGEAMACGVLCAVTDVGDSALIVGPTGHVVPPRNPEALASALEGLLALPPDERLRLGEVARRRVCELFDLGAVTRRYEALYEELANNGRGCVASGSPELRARASVRKVHGRRVHVIAGEAPSLIS